MSVTLATITEQFVPTPTGGPGRKINIDLSGNLWVMTNDNGTLKFWRSTNEGASWTEATGLRIAGVLNSQVASTWGFFLDDSGNMFVAYALAASPTVMLLRRCSAASFTAWDVTPTTIFTDTTGEPNVRVEAADVIAHTSGGGSSTVWVSFGVYGGDTDLSHGAYLFNIVRNSDGSYGVPHEKNFDGNWSGIQHMAPLLDFYHVGDGKTVKGGTPHIFWSTYPGDFIMLAYSGGTWSPHTRRQLVTPVQPGSVQTTAMAFDGSSIIWAIGYTAAGADTGIRIVERDGADLTTTVLPTPPASVGSINGIGLHSDPARNIYLYIEDNGTVKWSKYARASASWSSWTTLETGAQGVSLAVRKNAYNWRSDAVWMNGATVKTSVKFNRININVAPLAPLWFVDDNRPHDVAQPLELLWVFNGPEYGDVQTAFALRRQVGAGAFSYYNATTSTWGSTEVKNVSGNTEVDLAAAWAAGSDGTQKFSVKTWDVGDLEGPYSAALNVIPSVKVNPTITDPVAATPVDVGSKTATWTVAEQTSYRLALYSSFGGDLLWDSSWVFDSAARSRLIGVTLTNGGSYYLTLQTTNVEGLKSNEVGVAFTVDYAPPALPHTVAAPDDPTGAIGVSIVNPAPTGGQPNVISNDLWVRVNALSLLPDKHRPIAPSDGIRIARGLPDNGEFVDWAAASGVEYEYRVLTAGDNGTFIWSEWLFGTSPEGTRAYGDGLYGEGTYG